MPGMTGLELLPKAKAASTGRPGHHDYDTFTATTVLARKAWSSGADGKPFYVVDRFCQRFAARLTGGWRAQSRSSKPMSARADLRSDSLPRNSASLIDRLRSSTFRLSDAGFATWLIKHFQISIRESNWRSSQSNRSSPYTQRMLESHPAEFGGWPPLRAPTAFSPRHRGFAVGMRLVSWLNGAFVRRSSPTICPRRRSLRGRIDKATIKSQGALSRTTHLGLFGQVFNTRCHACRNSLRAERHRTAYRSPVTRLTR